MKALSDKKKKKSESISIIEWGTKGCVVILYVRLIIIVGSGLCISIVDSEHISSIANLKFRSNVVDDLEISGK